MTEGSADCVARVSMVATLAAALAACGDARGPDDPQTGTAADGGSDGGGDGSDGGGDGGDDAGEDASDDADDGGPSSTGGDSGGPPGDGPLVGELSIIPWPSGQASGPFELAFSERLQGQDANKSFPVVAELTGDGVLDVVVNPRLGYLSVYPGNGDGSR